MFLLTRCAQTLLSLLLLVGLTSPQGDPELITLKKALWLAKRHNVELQQSADQRYGLIFDQTGQLKNAVPASLGN